MCGRNWSQTQLAIKVDCHRRMIAGYENEATIPSTENLRKLAAAFGVTADFLLEGSPQSLDDISVGDNEFLAYVEDFKKLGPLEKKALKVIIEAVIMRSRMKQMIKED